MVEISSQATEIPKKSFKYNAVEWRISDGLVPYEDALAFMEQRVADIIAGHAGECVWLLEHPPLYTAGTSAKAEDLISAGEFPVYATGRGGQYTYHGPGQRVVYVMLNLAARGGDVRAFVQQLEDWIISTLAAFNIRGEKRCDRVGVWVQRPDKPPIYLPKSQSDLHEQGEARNVIENKNIMEDKIAALGIRLRKGVTFHGISINIEPDLNHFKGIVPCGISQYGVTSFWDLGHTVTMEEVDVVLKQEFEQMFMTDQAAGA